MITRSREEDFQRNNVYFHNMTFQMYRNKISDN